MINMRLKMKVQESYRQLPSRVLERATINKYKTIPKQNGKVVVFKLLGIRHETWRTNPDATWTSDMKTKHDPADNSHRICTYSRKITFLTITNVYETTRRQNVDQGLHVFNLAFSKITNTSVEILGSNMKRWTWLWNRICVLTAENIYFVSSSHMMLPMTRQWTAKATNKVALILAVCL